MLAIGRALMSEPRLLVLDEPSLGLAPEIVERIAEIIARINEPAPRSSSSSRTPRWRSGVADRAYVLEVGRVALEGPARELAAGDEVRAKYLGIVARRRGARGAHGAHRGDNDSRCTTVRP